jgi:hypothetical protein
MSQRLFSTLFAFALVILAGLIAGARGVLPSLDNLLGDLFTVVTPFVGILLTLNVWLDVVDAKVADGSLAAGDILGLLTSADFWTTMVAIFVGSGQALGIALIDPEQQALLVNGLLAFSWIVLRSFTNRTPKTQAARVQTIDSVTSTTTVVVS